jgi:hypothetical protein
VGYGFVSVGVGVWFLSTFKSSDAMNKMMIDPKYFKEYLKAFAETSLQVYEQAPGKVSIGRIKWDKKYRVSVTVNTEFEANEVRQLIEAAPYLYAALVDLPQRLGTTDDELYAWQCQARDALDKARGVK